jgi:integrase
MWRGVHHRVSLDKFAGKAIDSKSEAQDVAADFRRRVKAGEISKQADGSYGSPGVPRQHITVRQLADLYVERFVAVQRADTQTSFEDELRVICATVLPRPGGGSAPLGDWRVADVVTDTVERFREVRHAAGSGPAGVNRKLARLRALFAWAIVSGYTDATPFQRHGQPVVRLEREIARKRRLGQQRVDEEPRLLAACDPWLRAVVETALATGMRRGEILGLRWSQIDGASLNKNDVAWAPNARIVLHADETKTGRSRRVPIASRLRSVLALRRFDPAGEPLPLDAFVFGNEIGQRVDNFGRRWENAVLKAHGHRPLYSKTANLLPESRKTLAAIDLHFHDLRREAGSRWLDNGVPLHVIRDWLGHTNVAQTSTYLATTDGGSHDEMRRFEERLQNLAKDSEPGGRKRQSSASRRLEKPRKTAVRRDPATM